MFRTPQATARASQVFWAIIQLEDDVNPKLTEVEHIATAWTIHQTPNVHAGALFFISAVISDSPILLHQQPAMPPIWTAKPGERDNKERATSVCECECGDEM